MTTSGPNSTASVTPMRRLTTLLLALGLVLAACSPGGDEGTDSTTTTSGEVTSTTGAQAVDTTTTVAAETTTTEAPSSQGSSCVEGSWLLTADGFVEIMQGLLSESELGDTEITPADGTYVVTFDSGGTFTGVRDDWGFSVATDEGTFHIRINGMEDGTWSADDTTITVQVTSSDVVVSAQAEVDGQVLDIPNSPVDVPEAIAESSNYTCDGDTLTVTTQDISFNLERA